MMNHKGIIPIPEYLSEDCVPNPYANKKRRVDAVVKVEVNNVSEHAMNEKNSLKKKAEEIIKKEAETIDYVVKEHAKRRRQYEIVKSYAVKNSPTKRIVTTYIVA